MKERRNKTHQNRHYPACPGNPEYKWITRTGAGDDSLTLCLPRESGDLLKIGSKDPRFRGESRSIKPIKKYWDYYNA